MSSSLRMSSECWLSMRQRPGEDQSTPLSLLSSALKLWLIADVGHDTGSFAGGLAQKEVSAWEVCVADCDSCVGADTTPGRI